MQKKGLDVVRKDIAEFIKARDGGISSDPENIFLTTGASAGIKLMIKMLLNGPNEKPAGFMIPIPQYPLYSATISEYSSENVRIHFFN
jgi:alanine transaminase